VGSALNYRAIRFSGGHAMRKPFCFAAIVPALVAIMNSISPGQPPSTSSQAGATAPNAAEVASVAKANNRFALDLLRKLSTNTGENAFFSPYSVSTALAMTWAGARSQTADQMAKVLHFSDLPTANVTNSFRGLQQALAQTQQQTGAELSIANSLWPEKEPEHPFLPQYTQQVQDDFGSKVQPLDYRSNAEQARQEINRWVEDRTHHKIKDLLHNGDVDGKTRLVLVNAIYFKAPWFDPFSERATTDDQFHLANGTTKPIRLMRTTLSVPYVEETSDGASVQILALPYRDPNRAGGGGNGLSFVALLPKEPNALAAVEKTLSAEKLSDWLGEMKFNRVQIFLPKFKLEARYSLSDGLQEMGMTSAFIDPVSHAQDPNRADFAGMNGVRNLYISKAIHQTFVDVDEKGTEAAAATAIAMRAGAAPRQAEPAVFRADHPFLFLIRDDATGSILFLGRLANPPAQSPAAGK